MVKQPPRGEMFSGSEVFTGGEEVPESAAKTGLGEGLGRIRALTVAGLEQAHTLAAVRLESQRRELERLSVKMGAGHTRLHALQRRIDVGAEALQWMAVHVARAETIATPANPRRWIVHGYVRDADGHGVPGVTVALHDKSGRPPARVDRAATDESGYFELSSAGPFGGDPASGRRKAAGQAEERAGELFLLVMDGQRRLAADDEPLSPQVGRIDYREISVKDKPSGEPQRARRKRSAKTKKR